MELPVALGVDLADQPVVVDLTRMPHLLVAHNHAARVKAQTHRRFAPIADLPVGFKRNTRSI